jgi:hypothetical protein
MPALIDSAVTATTRQSENALSASEATTASMSRFDATGALRPPKPTAPYDRFMVWHPCDGRRITRLVRAKVAVVAGNIAAFALPIRRKY